MKQTHRKRRWCISRHSFDVSEYHRQQKKTASIKFKVNVQSQNKVNNFQVCKTSQESAMWTPGFQISVSKSFSSWWKASKAYVKDMPPLYSMSRHWLLSDCHYSPVTDVGGTDGCKHQATPEGQGVPWNRDFSSIPWIYVLSLDPRHSMLLQKSDNMILCNHCNIRVH